MKKIVLTMIASFILAACAPEPATPKPAGLTIRTNPNPNACPAGALPAPPARFRIDPLAKEQVVVIGSDGRRYLVWWAWGQAGDVTGPVVRDPNGVVVARDGELLEGPLLHGYQVCGTAKSIYILLV